MEGGEMRMASDTSASVSPRRWRPLQDARVEVVEENGVVSMVGNPGLDRTEDRSLITGRPGPASSISQTQFQ